MELGQVDFYVGSTEVGTVESAPFTRGPTSETAQVVFDSTLFGNGSYQVQAVAYDAAGNSATASRSITISNAGGSGGVLGYQAVGGATDFAPSGYLDVNGGFALGARSTISDGMAYLSGGNGTGQVREVVYADNGGKPAAAPVAVSGEVSVASGSAPGWRRFTFHGETLAAGSYWIGFWIGGWTGANHGSFYFTTTGSPTSTYYDEGHSYSSTGTPSSSAWTRTIDERVSAYLDIAPASGDSTPPTVSLTAPADGATVSGSVTVSATASDDTGVDHVDFFVGSSKVGTATSAPYQVVFDSTLFGNGSYQVQAVAYDAAGNSATASRSITISNAGGSGGVLGYQAVGGATDFAPSGYLDVNGGFALGARSTISDGMAYLSGGNGTGQVREVVYADNGGKPAAAPVAVSGEVSVASGSAPGWRRFTFHGETLAAGSYWIGFWIGGWTGANHGSFYYTTTGSPTSTYYDEGHSYSSTGTPSSSAWTRTIDERVSAYLDIAPASGDSTPPTVSLTAPADGATVSGSVTVSATASDDTGVDHVDFFVGSSKVGTATSAPYQVVFDSTLFGNGSYQVQAVAYDAAGNSATASRSITISNAGGSGGVLGYQAVGGATDFAPSGYLDVNGGFALGARSTISDGMAYLSGGNGTGQVREVVYADNGGKPAAAPVAVSGEVSVASGSAPGWRRFTFHGETLAAGSYWIGFWIGGWTGANHGSFYFTTTGSPTSTYYDEGHSYSSTGTPSSSAWTRTIDERVSAYLDIAPAP